MCDNNESNQREPISVFEGVVPRDLLEYMNASIDATRHRWRPTDGRRASTMARKFAELLRGVDGFNAMEKQVCRAAHRWAAAELGREFADDQRYVLRCVGLRMSSQSYLRHFDSHILTLLIPLQQAEAGERNGDLILYKRQRQSISVLTNVLAKAWLWFEHGLPFSIRRALSDRDRSKGRCERIAFTLGNVYVFNGLVTLHNNLDVESGERRTLIIHHYDPGLTGGTRSITRTFRALRDRLADLY